MNGLQKFKFLIKQQNNQKNLEKYRKNRIIKTKCDGLGSRITGLLDDLVTYSLRLFLCLVIIQLLFIQFYYTAPAMCMRDEPLIT